jgi:hypothetical protein
MSVVFEEAFLEDLEALTTSFVQRIQKGEQPSLDTFKCVWREAVFGAVHHAKVRGMSDAERLQVLYATVVLSLLCAIEENEGERVIALVYTLLCLFHTQLSEPKIPIRLRLSDIESLEGVQSKHFCTTAGTTDAVALLFSGRCISLCAYIGPIGFVKSYETCAVPSTPEVRGRKRLLDERREEDGGEGNWGSIAHEIEERNRKMLCIEKIAQSSSEYCASVSRMMSTISAKSRHSITNRASFLKPFGRVHGRNAGRISARPVNYEELRKELRYDKVHLDRRLNHVLSKFHSVASRARIMRLTRIQPDD